MSQKRIILFGRSGSGKSTIGNMLTQHVPDIDGGFPISDRFKGVTENVQIRNGQNWEVVDTVGLEETKKGSVSNDDAKSFLMAFLKQIRYSYSFIIYVAKKGRTDQSEARAWEAFKEIFKGSESNFIVLFTSATPKWINENMADIGRQFYGCNKFIAVDFPPVSIDETSEERNKGTRLDSLSSLKEELQPDKLSPVEPIILQKNDEELDSYVDKLPQTILDVFSAAFQRPEQHGSSLNQKKMKTVLLFGKTGDGKSTISNMLTGSKSPQGDNLSSVTRKVFQAEGGDWTVIDTIGIGESLQETKVNTRLALESLKSFLDGYQKPVDLICYVMRKGRFTMHDFLYWKCFKKLFEGHEGNFRLIITSCSAEWLNDNRHFIESDLGKYPMISIDFPPSIDDEKIEKLLQVKRSKDLESLQNFLRTPETEPIKPPVIDRNAISEIQKIIAGHAKNATSVGDF